MKPEGTRISKGPTNDRELNALDSIGEAIIDSILTI